MRFSVHGWRRHCLWSHHLHPCGTSGRSEVNGIAPPDYGPALAVKLPMTDTTKPEPRPLFTPSTLPHSSAPDPVVMAIEAALLAIANRQDEARRDPHAVRGREFENVLGVAKLREA